MKLLIAIPTKTGPEYLERARACEETWLKDCPVDYKFFRDTDFGLNENDELIRQKRMKLMCQFALDNGYTFIYRVDSDAFVCINRLLTCGFEQHEYMGWCLEYSGWKARNRTAHGGSGFFLSRKAMELVVKAEHFPHDGVYWGDIWTGQLLYDNGVTCHSDRRFYDDINLVPAKDNFISIHPLDIEQMRAINGQ